VENKKLSWRIAAFIIGNRWLSAAVMVVVTAFFAIGLRNVELKTVFSDLLPSNHPFVQTFKAHPNFGNPLTVTLMVKRKDGDIYNAETLAKVWDLTRDIDLAPAVDHDQVLSIATEKARYAVATPGGLEVKPLMEDHPPRTPEEIAEFRSRVLKAPNARSFLISNDGTATLVNATFIERRIDYGETFNYLQGLVEKARDAHHEVHMAGQPALSGWVVFYEWQMLGIFGVTAAALLISLVLYMRNIAGTVGPVLASVVSATWGFGFVGWLKVPVEPLVMVVPLLLVARSFSHCVQATERYYEVLAHVKHRRKAAEISMAVMMPPGVLGIFTDVAGLMLIAVAPIPAMQRFALFTGFWAMMLVPTSVLLTPLALIWLPKPRNVDTIVGGGESGGFHRAMKLLLDYIAHLTFGKKARTTTIILAIAVVIAGWEFTKLQVGNPVEGTGLLHPTSEFNRAVATINRHFPGVNTLEVVFEAKGNNALDRVARKADTILTMQQFQHIMESYEHPPAATLSFADYLPEANRLFSGGNPKWAPLDPDDASVSAAAGALMVGTSPKAFLHVTDFEQRNGTVSLWYKDNKQATVDEALRQAREAVAKVGADHKDFTIRLASGTIALQQSINDTVDKYQVVILTLLNLVILVGCGWAYRSVVAGLILLIPVNLSNLFLTAVMTAMGIGLDVNTLPIMAIGIGVGIDYGIYLLSRICEEYQDYKEEGAAILASVTTTGKAIFFTALINLVGILPWYFMSELKFLADMGLMLVMVMLINMVLSLVVLPLCVWLIKPKFLRSNDLRVGEGVDLSQFVFHEDGVVDEAKKIEGVA